MATARATTRSHKTKVLGLYPHEMRIAIGIEELEFCIADDIETNYAVHATNCVSDRALIELR